jgi:hypothetical protein
MQSELKKYFDDCGIRDCGYNSTHRGLGALIKKLIRLLS